MPRSTFGCAVSAPATHGQLGQLDEITALTVTGAPTTASGDQKFHRAQITNP